MPTENRSSNTEIAAKLSPCPFCGQQDAFVEQLDSDASVVICQGRIDEYSACLARGPVGVQQQESEDQPGHDQAVKEWNKRAAAQNHPEPIAWMVGTAFWWTKEEAERDAAETGKTITPIGPMSGIAPAEEHQGEPAALPERKAITAHGLTALDSEAEGWNACLDEIAKLGPRYTHPVRGEPVGYMNQASIDAIRSHGQALIMVGVNGFPPGDKAIPLYTHADPGEVERLRAALRFYADREHYHFESGNWDTVSGEPLNILWCGEEPDFIEDGSVARAALERKL
ncbi:MULTISPECIES: Lar family restriction alleviation protein [unclassified Pseudomonas]|uniref:Lar family restriction alleviation protein n=1 Tax=unclassified Pseudomonas TaxID=196821 RepID=UPI0021BA9A4D|nr:MULTISPECIES: Lar family restriction alleviation protein [unclassified Pseudomonas]MCT8164972.1 Lar family restriction alleviation protein [Pseudomonas sp. HD6422]MCT8183870.1 Lar family restriction alleviation protein [Pseudomonas sp. HD6421]